MIFNNYSPIPYNNKDNYSNNYDTYKQPEWSQNNYQKPQNYSPVIAVPYQTNNKDISEAITSDKLNLLSTTIDHLTYQINKRAKIRDFNIDDLDHKLCDTEGKLLNLDAFPHNINPLIESKRSECYRTINQLKSDKNQEVVRCWKDQSSLYTDLLKAIGEYRSIKRRSNILSGGY